MNRKKLSWARCILVGIFSLSAFVARAEKPEGYVFLPYDQGVKKAQASGKNVFVYFGRPGCGFCEMMNKQVFAREEVKQAYSAHYVLTYVNSESGQRLTLPSGERITEMQLGERMNTRGTPVYIFIDPSGKQIVRRFGTQSLETMLLLDRFVHEGHYRSKTFAEFEKQAVQ